MSKLCLGSYLTIIIRCKVASCTQKALVGVIMHSLDSRFDETDDSLISNIVAGRKNPPDYIVESGAEYTEEDYHGLVNYFEEKVLNLINPSEIKLLQNALFYLIENDDDIADESVVEVISKTKKSDIKKSDDTAILLAGLFLYILKTTDNIKREKSVRELSDGFFKRMKKSIVNKRKKNPSKNVDPDAVYQEAQAFCIDYEDEIELLPLCQIAAFIDPLHKHVRQMYTDYSKCSKLVRKKILELKDVKQLDFSDEEWVKKSLHKFDSRIREKKLCTLQFLYDGGKYFHRAYERYSSVVVDFNPYIFESPIKVKSIFGPKDLKCTFSTVVRDYLELKHNKSRRKLEPPIDAVWAYCMDSNVPEENVTYWVCMMIIATCHWLDDWEDGVQTQYNEDNIANVDLGDSECLIETQEDMYFYALLELYKFYYTSLQV